MENSQNSVPEIHADEVVQAPLVQSVPVAQVLPPNPGETVRQTLIELPKLAACELDLLVLYTSHMFVVRSDMDFVAALEELELARGWDSERISVAAKRVLDNLVHIWLDLSNQFYESASSDGQQRKALDLALLVDRFEEERREQDQLCQRATQLLLLVKTTCGQLGVSNPDTPQVVTPKPITSASMSSTANQPVSQARGLGGLIHSLKEMLVVQPASYQMEEVAVELIAPSIVKERVSWKTPPILVESHKSVKSLERLIAKYASESSDAQLALGALSALGVSRDRIEEDLREVVTLCRTQLQQSEEIERNVSAEFGDMRVRVEALGRIREIIQQVITFYGLSVELSPHQEAG